MPFSVGGIFLVSMVTWQNKKKFSEIFFFFFYFSSSSFTLYFYLTFFVERNFFDKFLVFFSYF
ncbi:unnamed protein product [Meloidogyne enterolobii]|uniref:Uncharacterized protein n=1 Tax=Meloidogyne enterolobii TaxID=390850 RepID=A0ACB0XNL3_MELEN